MGTILYDLAVSLDGYITGQDDDISRWWAIMAGANSKACPKSQRHG